MECSVTCNFIRTRGWRRQKNWKFLPTSKYTTYTLEIRGHKLLSLLVLSFTATPAVPKLLSEWQVGELATLLLLKPTEGCLQFAFSLERCMYVCMYVRTYVCIYMYVYMYVCMAAASHNSSSKMVIYSL